MVRMLAVIAVVVSVGGEARAQSRNRPDPKAVYSVPVKGSPIRGDAHAPITLVYACDYSGPYCARIRTTFDELFQMYPDKLRLVHKHFVVYPERSTAPALAACAAHRQGKFWKMDRLLWEKGYKDNRNYSDDNLEAIAKAAGLNLRKYRAAIRKNGKCAEIIEAEQKQMTKIGTSGVPATYINGRFLSGARPTSDFEAVIEEELKNFEERTGKSKRKRKNYYRTWVVKKGLEKLTVAKAGSGKGTGKAEREGKGDARSRWAKRRPDPKATYSIAVGNSPFRGPADAKVTIVIACQFTGPYCKKIRPTIDELIDRYNKDIRVVYKHFPVHTNRATKPALAACAAHKQGKYWAMESLLWGPLYDDRDFTDERLRSAARSIGLDMVKYERDIGKPCETVIEAETAEVKKVGTSGTPSTYINGRHVSGARPLSAFETVVEEELKKANKRLRRKKSAKGYYNRWVVKRGIKKFVPED